MLQDDAKAVATGTLRQRMEQHRSNPNCAVCHKEMDALGFALENFDAIGAWRTKDGNFPIDAAAKLPDGRSFNGPRELKAILRGSKELFARCLAEKLLTYAIGRGIESYDRPAIDEIVDMLRRPAITSSRRLSWVSSTATRFKNARQTRKRRMRSYGARAGRFLGGLFCGASARRSLCRGWSRSCRGCRRRRRADCRGAWPFSRFPTASTCPIGRRRKKARSMSCPRSSRRWSRCGRASRCSPA